jgi:hypothetical protein
MLQTAAEARTEATEQAEKDRVRQDRKAGPAPASDKPRAILEPYAIGDKIDKAV